MQTFLVYNDPIKSAWALDPKRRFSQIYEGLHILASNLGVADSLVTPKRDVSNHPIARLWKGHERALWWYIVAHYEAWTIEGQKLVQPTINKKNIDILEPLCNGSSLIPTAVKNLIPSYRRLLLTKDPKFYARYGW